MAVIYVIATLDIPEMDFTVMVSFKRTKFFSVPTNGPVIFRFRYHSFVDINECRVGSHSCSTNTDCTNTIGSFECKCKFGLNGNGFLCKASFSFLPKSSHIASNDFVVSRF